MTTSEISKNLDKIAQKEKTQKEFESNEKVELFKKFEKQFSKQIKKFNEEMYDMYEDGLAFNAKNSFRNEIDTIPTNKGDIALLKIQYIINELTLEDFAQREEFEQYDKHLISLNKYF